MGHVMSHPVKPFHELTQAELAAIPLMTYREFEELYPGPAWCSYHHPTMGEMGCSSLLAGFVTGEEYCKTCDCYNATVGR